MINFNFSHPEFVTLLAEVKTVYFDALPQSNLFCKSPLFTPDDLFLALGYSIINGYLEGNSVWRFVSCKCQDFNLCGSCPLSELLDMLLNSNKTEKRLLWANF